MLGRFLGLFFTAACLFVPLQAEALTIAPLRQTAVVAPGEETTVSLFVVNNTDRAFAVEPEVDGFRVDAHTGAALFGVADPAVSWITPLEQELYVRPGETGQFRFLIRPPEDEGSGAHYLGLFAADSAGDGQVGIGSRVGSLLFLHIAGPVQESLTVQDLSLARTSIFQKDRTAYIDLENTGDIHVVPHVKMTVVNARGAIVHEELVNGEDHKILAQGRMQREVALPPLRMLDAGKGEVILQVGYGLTEQVVTKRIAFWYVPLSGVIGIGVLLLCIIGVYFLNKKKKKIHA